MGETKVLARRAFAAALALALAGCANSSGGPLTFERGQQTRQTYATATAFDQDGDWQAEAHYGGGAFVLDGVSANLEGFAGVADEQDRDRTSGLAGADGILRLHTPPIGPVRLHFDGGVGVQVASNPFPGGSNHNFRLLAGPGLTVRLREDLHLIGGVRYFHLSNAGTGRGNSAVDAAQIGLGVIWAH